MAMSFKVTTPLIYLQKKLISFPKSLILLTIISSIFCLDYIVNNLGFNTDTTQILASDLPFQQHRQIFLKTFPQDDAAILIVIDSPAPEQSARILHRLKQQFKRETTYFNSVYTPGYSDFFSRNGLLYLSIPELEDVTSKLSEAQPFIGRLQQDPSLSGFLTTLDLALSTDHSELPIDLQAMLNQISQALEATLHNREFNLSWQELMLPKSNEQSGQQRFILVKPKLDFNDLMPAEQALLKTREIVDQTLALYPQATLRITGEVALEHDELEGISESMVVASLISLFLVCCSILIGLKSFKMMLATLFSLITGLIYTAAFATFSIGHLNLISVAFSVLYIGLGVDYAVHLCLRYRELLQLNINSEQALTQSVQEVGPALALCAFTTSAGFFAFVPTSYAGVSELGVIAGAGMFIALSISLSVLPALLAIFPVKAAPLRANNTFLPPALYRFPEQHSRAIRYAAILLSIAGACLLSQVSFDFNPVNLRDPNSESVAAFKDLLREKNASPLTLTVLSENQEQALTMTQQLTELDTVQYAVTLFDYIPDNQSDKLEMIETLSLVLGMESEQFPKLSNPQLNDSVTALKKLLHTLKQVNSTTTGLEASELQTHLQRYLEKLESQSPEQQRQSIEQLQIQLLDYLPDTMNLLFAGLQAQPVDINQLPVELKQRWLSETGIYRVMAMPAEDLNEVSHLRQFVTEIQTIAPEATDLPAIYLASGQEVVKAFQQALTGALLAILCILLVVQRNVKTALITLLPLCIAAILTGASTVLIGSPFNFANIIAVPLIFGLGVDSGIHIMHRLQHPLSANEQILTTGTARAVFFSGLTTLFSFVSLAFTPHLGISSMGTLLAIAITLIIICTLIILPAFFSKLQKHQSSRDEVQGSEAVV